MDQKQRAEKIQKLDEEINDLYRQIDVLTEICTKLENIRDCDICGNEYKLINLNGTCGGVDFSLSDFEPVVYEDKSVNCVCARCMRKKWDEVYETH